MSKTVIILKVDPERQRITRMPIKPSVSGVRRLIGAAAIGHRILLTKANEAGEDLLVAARVEQDPAKPTKEWRLRGGDNTVGVGLLFGTFTIQTEDEARRYNKPIGWRANGMSHVPVDVAWLERRIVWCEPGENAPAAEVREEMGLAAGDGCAHHQEEGDADERCAPGEDE